MEKSLELCKALANQMKSTDFSWLHLSDFHLGKDNYAQSRILEWILAEIDATIAANRKPDFVFITGDLASKGRDAEFEQFDKEFLVPLMERLGDTHFDRIFLVPGNHDVDRSKSKAVKRYDVLDEIQNFLDPTAEGRVEREQILPRFKAFDEYPWYLEQHKWVSSTNGYQARRIVLPSGVVGILCINTSWFCGGENEQGRLNPGLGMLEQGIIELAGCETIFVLGHHPVDWLAPTIAQRFLAMLGKIGAIYLHGHLHKTSNISQLVGTSAVVCLQAGCAFFARDDEQWVTRLIWGGIECSTQQIHVQPKKWNANHREWVLDADAFPNSLRAADGDFWILQTRPIRPDDRQVLTGLAKPAKASITPPEGWVLLDGVYLGERRQPVSDERILQYFEGRVPQWEDVLSGRIPSRSIVNDLVATLTNGFDGDGPQLTLLLGAGGEGKSTAFLQTLERIASNQRVKVLWRSNPERSLPVSFVSSLHGTGDTWLLASDEGDSIIKETHQVLQSLARNAKVHLFLACRDTDWIENHGNDFQWNQVAEFVERRMKGLDEIDAREIVMAWGMLGARGLGRLSGSSMDEAVGQLVEAARVEASTSDGAFLGAMLRVRVGVALRDHVAALMVRLESRDIKGLPGKTLLDAFACIAIPHAFNLLFLSKSVLGKALGIDESRVRRRILGPLGEEAAAGAAGQFILTRHRAIAEAAMEIASMRFDVDPEEILSDLVRAALTANEEGSLVPHLSDWRYLSSRMFEQGNQSLGVRLATTAVAADPTNSFLAVKLAQLYRAAGQAERSAAVFRKSYQKAQGNRAFYTEWATCEGFIGNMGLSIWSAISLADGTEMRPPDVKDVGFGLTGCLVNFLALFERYQNPVFLSAAAAADRIARRITLPRAAFDEIENRQQSLIDLNANLNISPNRLADDLIAGVSRAYDQREIVLWSTLSSPSNLTFEALKEIARIRF